MCVDYMPTLKIGNLEISTPIAGKDLTLGVELVEIL